MRRLNGSVSHNRIGRAPHAKRFPASHIPIVAGPTVLIQSRGREMESRRRITDPNIYQRHPRRPYNMAGGFTQLRRTTPRPLILACVLSLAAAFFAVRYPDVKGASLGSYVSCTSSTQPCCSSGWMPSSTLAQPPWDSGCGLRAASITACHPVTTPAGCSPEPSPLPCSSPPEGGPKLPDPPCWIARPSPPPSGQG